MMRSLVAHIQLVTMPLFCLTIARVDSASAIRHAQPAHLCEHPLGAGALPQDPLHQGLDVPQLDGPRGLDLHLGAGLGRLVGGWVGAARFGVWVLLVASCTALSETDSTR
jgi:hypothetical protein